MLKNSIPGEATWFGPNPLTTTNPDNVKGLQRKPEPEGLPRLELQLVERMTHVDIVDALSDTEHWLNWSRFFGPISGHEHAA